MLAGVKMTHVPYKGTGPALNDLLGGQIQLMFGSMPAMVPQLKTNRLRGIGVTTTTRNNAVPDIPPVADTVPGYEAVLWYAAWGPRACRQDIVALWNRESQPHRADPGNERPHGRRRPRAAGGPPERFRDVLQRDVAKWTKVVKTAGIKTER